MAASVSTVVAKQEGLVGLISRAVLNYKKLEIKKRTALQVQTRIENLGSNWGKFQSNHEQLLQLKRDERKELPYFSEQLYEVCEEAYIDARSDLLAILNELHEASGSSFASKPSVETQGTRATTSRQLPRINLPSFVGTYSDWTQFRDLFTSMIGANREITGVEKMQYLKMSVKGDAAQVIKNITVTGDNFERAWQTLVTRYENKRVLIDTHLAALFSVRHVTHQSASELKALLGDVQEAVGITSTQHWDHILVFMVARKLDSASLTDWEKQLGANTDPAAFSDLESFLLARIRAFEAVERTSGTSKSRQTAGTGGKTSQVAKSHEAVGPAVAVRSDAPVNASKLSTTSCTLCNAPHYIASCPEFRGKGLNERREIVNQKGLCFNCLGPHQYRNCRTNKRCRECGNPHHTLLHRPDESHSRTPNPLVQNLSNATSASSDPVVLGSNAATFAPSRRDNANAGASASSNSALAPKLRYAPVLLATAIVKVTSRYGENIEVRALLDQGSEVSFITESLAQRLNHPRHHVSLPISGIGAQKSSLSKGVVTIDIASRATPSDALSVNAYILAKLTLYLPPIQIFENHWPHLIDLDLADPSFTSAKQIDLVLGVEVYSRILEEGLRKGSPSSPVAQKTTLGWILSGSTSNQSQYNLEDRRVHGLQCSVDHDLLDLLENFWLQEETCLSAKSSISEDEALCEQHFSQTHTRSPEGRYIVRLPLKRVPENLGDSRTIAANMLVRQEKRFAASSSLKDAYSTFLSEYETLGHMTRVPESLDEPNRVFYLPHHAVIRESSSTTKVRVVFHGSQRTNRGRSINDFLYVGPKLQTDLADVIAHWRRYKYVFSADIEKMYRQVRVHPEDWNLQRIVWRTNPEEPIRSFQLCTVTYGLASAPYLAIRTLRQLAIDEEAQYPLAKKIIEREIYVDDVLSGADTVEDAKSKIFEINSCLAAGGFVLQKWCSNNEPMLADLPPEKRELSAPLSLDNEPLFRTLGILWQPRADAFTFTTRGLDNPFLATKRTVLSRVAQLFDPLGWIAPVMIRGKLFMQELWTLSLEWDDQLPEEFCSRWNKFVNDLNEISSISVPRWLGIQSSSLAVEIHGFSDASQAALGAVLYLRVIDHLDNARVTLISAKTRVAPLKKVTIPRLELSAAVLLVRQMAHVQKALDLEHVYTHLWTDSTVASAYIQGDASRWAEYVRNHVTEINQLPRSRWHHVPGKENPADFVSRRLSPRQLKNEKLWWNGPTWLPRHSTFWPSSIPPLSSDAVLEIRKTSAGLVNQQPCSEIWSLIDRYSTLKPLLRVTAWCFRAAKKFQRNQEAYGIDLPLHPNELDAARIFWVKKIQATYFKIELSQLSYGKKLSGSSPLIRLTPFVDSSGLLRVGGRLRNALIGNDEKHPLILPRESSLTTLIIDHCHRRTLHGGTQLTLATLRLQYWVVGGRMPVRSFIHRCLTCVRHRATLGTQLMGQVPESRVRQARPFENSGVDYAGPFTLRTFCGRGAKTYKGYLVVFVCMSSSAIHLELATDYTTDGFIAAYQRFTSRRGICATLTSDCGTNLVGADAELRRLFRASSKEFAALTKILANDGTHWKFNPPSAPHFGGKWESAVKSAKFHIKRIIGDTGLTYEEFSTLLAQIEAVLNSRPICALSDDPSDLSALTPGHFLIGSALNTLREPSVSDLPRSRLSRWKMLRQMLEHFWQRWRTEYLRGLQAVPKWHHRTDSLKIGSLVLINDDQYPPSKWPLGRIIDVHPGKDGLVRVATMKTAQSIYKRPIVKLCLLPIEPADDASAGNHD